MTLFKFRVSWEDDEQLYRDIELLAGQSFIEFQKAILQSWEFDQKHEASFFECDDKWRKLREFSSEVKSNKKEAAVLSMAKTPVSALVSKPNQKFIYEYDRVKLWTFLVELIGVSKEVNDKITYPNCARKVGI